MSIKNFAQLLEEIKCLGINKINNSTKVNHPGIIGQIYEGLTKELLEEAIFNGLNLRVCTGKIKNEKNEHSSQIDCMIVVGEGEKIPFTNNYIYHYNQVIAVIEVKKTLNKQQLSDAHKNLQSIIKVSRADDGFYEKYIHKILKSSWESLTNMELPARDEVDDLSDKYKNIYHALFREASCPIRIVMGYSGYKSEYALREGFVKFLEDNIDESDFGIVSLPNLVICGDYSIVKLNGMPFQIQLQDSDFYWSCMASCSNSSLLNLIELIWTRISFRFNISSKIFDDDLYLQTMNRFIDTKYVRLNNNKGWEHSYYRITKLNLEKRIEPKLWQPKEIIFEEFLIIDKVIKSKSITFDDLQKSLNVKDNDKHTLLKKIDILVFKRLIFIKNNIIKPSTKECMVVFLNEKFYAGDNSNNLMVKWIQNQMNRDN